MISEEIQRFNLRYSKHQDISATLLDIDTCSTGSACMHGQHACLFARHDTGLCSERACSTWRWWENVHWPFLLKMDCASLVQDHLRTGMMEAWRVVLRCHALICASRLGDGGALAPPVAVLPWPHQPPHSWPPRLRCPICPQLRLPQRALQAALLSGVLVSCAGHSAAVVHAPPHCNDSRVWSNGFLLTS